MALGEQIQVACASVTVLSGCSNKWAEEPCLFGSEWKYKLQLMVKLLSLRSNFLVRSTSVYVLSGRKGLPFGLMPCRTRGDDLFDHSVGCMLEDGG